MTYNVFGGTLNSTNSTQLYPYELRGYMIYHMKPDCHLSMLNTCFWIGLQGESA